ncbi:MAG: efflux RND transporter periplasmic adaptor subunit [Fimbriimonadaceae bacterium]
MKKLLLWGLPVVLLGGLVAWRFTTKKDEAGQPGAMGQRPGGGGAPAGGGGAGGGGRGGGGGPAAVELATAGPKIVIESLDSVGTVESPQRVLISPKTSGRIEYLQVREGDVVQPGQVLVRIDPSEVQAAVFQQQANVAEATSRLAQAQLGRGPTEVGISGEIAQQRAALSSAQADYNQVRRNYDAQITSAQAGVDDAKAKVNSAESLAQNAQSELKKQEASLKNAEARLARIENLYRQGFIAAQDVDDAKTAVEVQRGSVAVASGQVASSKSAIRSAEAQKSSADQQLSIAKRKGQADVEAARARVTQAKAALSVATANRSQNPAFAQNIAALQASVRAAQAQLGQAQARLADTVLRSPIQGTVTARTADPGSLGSPGTPVVTVQYLDWVYVTASLSIDQAGAIRKGQQASVKLDALPGRTFTGSVSNINPAADVESRQFGIKVRLANPGQVLRPGMFGRVSFVMRRVDAPVAVPREAVKTGPEGETVTVIDKDMTARVRPVKLGVQDATHVQVLSGVARGEKVVVLSFMPLREGQKISPPGGSGRGGRP